MDDAGGLLADIGSDRCPALCQARLGQGLPAPDSGTGNATARPARLGRLGPTMDLADDEQARVGRAADRHVCLNWAASAVPRSPESPGSGDNLSPVWRQAWDRTGSDDLKEEAPGMNVALTSATGFIGSHVLTELHEHGHEVTALLRDAAQ